MSSWLSIAAALLATGLIYARRRRLSCRLPLPRIARAKSRALVEAAAAALTLLMVGAVLAPAIDPGLAAFRQLFGALALAVAWLQFQQCWRARRTRGA